MITYEVSAIVEPHLVESYERYMRQHIPDVLATGCFRVAAFAHATAGHFRTRYEASTVEDLERYLAVHAPRLREDFRVHFPEGVALSREVWSDIERWDAPPEPGPSEAWSGGPTPAEY